MARFPYHQRNIAALGRLLAEARLDPDKFRKLKSAPEKTLAEIGLPKQVTSLIQFEIVDGDHHNPVALPYRLNQSRLSEGDSEYLASVAGMFSDASSETGAISKEKPLN
ncbi:hypothetical protein [Roseibium sp. MMSF_3544]|uniref:hypothetical protein n=1 Tax=unclassified Roseibium TaxID=2629323 RepID=UPI00273E4214|nr:hypothetical protein [Roseibium sp. MMSF_3544]